MLAEENMGKFGDCLLIDQSFPIQILNIVNALKCNRKLTLFAKVLAAFRMRE